MRWIGPKRSVSGLELGGSHGGSSSLLRRRRLPVRVRIEGDIRQTTAAWRNFPRSPSPDPHAEGICGEDIRTSIAADLLVRRHFSRPDIPAQYLGGSSGHESTSRVREFRGTTKGRRFPDCDGHDLTCPQPCDGGLCPPFGRRRSQGRCPAGPGIRGAGSSPRNQTRMGKPIPVSSPGSGLVARMELRRPSHVPGMRPRWSRADGRGWSVGVTGASIQSGYRGRTPGQGRAVGSWAEDTMASCETSGR